MEREEKGLASEGNAVIGEEIAVVEAEIAEIRRQLAETEEQKPGTGENSNSGIFGISGIQGNSANFAIFANLYRDEKVKTPPFPVDALPDEIKGYIEAASESLQVPVDMVASLTIAIISLCIQGKFFIEVKPDWVEPINLYMVVVSPPSERKSPTLKAVTAPVFKYVKETNERRQPMVSEYELKKRILSRKLKSIEEGLSKGGDKCKYTMQDAIDCQKEIDDLEAVTLLKLILDDVTPEALVKAMQENGEKIGIVSAEGGIFGTMAGRYSDHTNIDIFLKSYSGEYYSAVRIGRQENELAKPLLTIALAVQPRVIETVMSNGDFTGRGLLARFLYCIPSSLVGTRKYRTKPINVFTKESYENLVNELLNIPGTMFDERMIHLSQEADALCEEYNGWIEQRLLNEFEQIEEWAGKLHGNTMRIAAIFHVIRYKLGAVNVPLEGETMRAAIEIGKYYLEHSKVAFDIMGLSDPKDVKDAKYIIQRMDGNSKNIKNSKNISKRDLFDLCKGHLKTVEEMEPGLKVLEEHGYIARVQEKKEGRGRPSEMIYVNPEYYKEREQNDRKR